MDASAIALINSFVTGPLTLGKVVALIVAVIAALAGIGRGFILRDRPLNFQSLREDKLRLRLDWLEKQLKESNSSELEDILREERERIIFLLVSGLDAKSTYRAGLLELYKYYPHRLSWRHIRAASVYLKYENGKFWKGLGKIDWVFGWLLFLLGMVSMVGAILIFIFISCLAFYTTGWHWQQWALTGVLMPVVLFLLGFLYVKWAEPFLLARQLQQWLPEKLSLPPAP